MPRPRCKRSIGFLPEITYFKPAGIKLTELDEVILQHDELEAIRLKDLLGQSQEDAARQMNVSQPTFHRLLSSAHEKIASAIVNGKALRIEGGNVAIDERSVPPCGWRHICRYGWKERPGVNKGRKPLISEKGDTMKIAITSTDGTMEGMVDERFGRCKKFIVYDTETKTHTVIDNSLNMGAAQGAGIQTAQNIINSGAKIVISGHLGPNAYRVLNSAGIDIYTASNMTVIQAIAAYEQGKLNKLSGPDVSGHW
ncbi:MAG TPA: DUF134 domain-containing protein [Syntrophorhabdaceae bacterium]|nr:DUF134 domain-containing protein [Syntrophorhabdaceae bacterium]HPC67720.1 DUF134 domain-containing protein [Syntrophorhabdaceae bacterium]HQE80762.1 DUF134 domain-containing protein [Syntrophorhabdaceae bacterium]HQH44281.1 DUF134 domain-containing protein [Syntrophorhabdaceae bacterium]